MPLKHSIETAYMFVLGLVICITGFFVSLLPAIPVGTKYWAILLTITVLYPLALARTFKSNRADYEFRMLHWFPMCIVVLWFIMQLLGPRAELLRIFQLGLFFLWSLPLVALGIAFMMIFAVHVLRRSRIRVIVLSVFLMLLTAGAVFAEANGTNEKLQAVLFPKEIPSLSSLNVAFQNLRASFGLSGTSGILMALNDSSSKGMSSSKGKFIIPSTSSSKMPSSFSSSTSRPVAILPPAIIDRKPGHLTQSGPESVAVLGATLLAAYFGLLHARARKRA